MIIDAVYTWVDGSDHEWIKRRNNKLKNFKYLIEESTNNALFDDNEELKFSLRSIERYAPWINRIYIITDRQIPTWINLNNPRIKIIDHREIFNNKTVLPTFSSQVIETQLHHIKDLSEHFLYFNDDMFIGKKCSPDYFFTKTGKPRIFVSELIAIPNRKSFDISRRAKSKRNSYQYNLIKTRQVLKDRTGKAVYNNIRHTVKPMIKSLLYKLEKEFSEEYNRTIKNSFRTNEDILFVYLFEFYLIANNLGKPKYLITSDTKKKIFDPLNKLQKKFTFGYINLDDKDIVEHLGRLKRARPFTFCLNQTPKTPTQNILKAKMFLEEYFPGKSQFEK